MKRFGFEKPERRVVVADSSWWFWYTAEETLLDCVDILDLFPGGSPVPTPSRAPSGNLQRRLRRLLAPPGEALHSGRIEVRSTRKPLPIDNLSVYSDALALRGGIVMAARDRWVMELRCPACEQTDQASVSENDYAFMRHPDLSVDCVQNHMFVVVRRARHRHETEVRCIACGQRFHL